MLRERCGRCRGQLYIERDIGAEEIVCLQCGRRRDANPAFVPLDKPYMPERLPGHRPQQRDVQPKAPLSQQDRERVSKRAQKVAPVAQNRFALPPRNPSSPQGRTA